MLSSTKIISVMVQSNRASSLRLLTSFTFQKALCANNLPSSSSLSTLGKSISKCLMPLSRMKVAASSNKYGGFVFE